MKKVIKLVSLLLAISLLIFIPYCISHTSKLGHERYLSNGIKSGDIVRTKVSGDVYVLLHDCDLGYCRYRVRFNNGSKGWIKDSEIVKEY